jgi:diguanylate cyclase (GGDEF)-like protein
MNPSQLARSTTDGRRDATVRELSNASDPLEEAWRERCRLDPYLDEQAPPPMADALIAAVSSALDRAQAPSPDLDPRLQSVAMAFARRVGSPDVALAQLVCLHKVLASALLRRRVATSGSVESPLMMAELFECLMIVVARECATQLRVAATRDPSTGFGNRTAFELGFATERARAQRHQRFFTVTVIRLDGLGAISDSRGHRAGDALLRPAARALHAACRRSDAIYWIADDAFAVVMPETEHSGAATFVTRQGAAMPAFSFGTAIFPSDGFRLLEVADRRLSPAPAPRGPRHASVARVS